MRPNIKHKVLALMLTIAALLTGQTLQAQSTWTVTSIPGVTFTIKRSDKSTEETIYYRTVSLSAYEGLYYGGTYGTLTFGVGESEKKVDVTLYEIVNNTGEREVFRFREASSDKHSFRFEVLDITGRTVLASQTKEYSDNLKIVNGNYISKNITDLVYLDEQGNFASGLPSGKYLDLHNSAYVADPDGYYTITDRGYMGNGYVSYSLQDFIRGVCEEHDYWDKMGAKIYVTACFTMYEEMDGYQYIQISDDYSYDSGDDPNEKVNDPVNSFYKACFILSLTPTGSVMSTPHHQFFPHRYDYKNWSEENTAGISHHEFDYYNSYLYQQKFKEGYRANNSGAVVVPHSTNYLRLFFDAGGGSDRDAWCLKKDIFLRLAVGDDVAPTIFSNPNPIVSAGYHHRGAQETITVPFSEVVKVTGTAYLYTSWGRFAYDAGSGTNVLSFTGVIDAEPGTALNITSISNTVTDLAGNTVAWPGTITLNSTVTPLNEGSDDIADHFLFDSQGRALISSQSDLQRLSDYVSGYNHDCSGITFLQTKAITCDPNAPHISPIGTGIRPFRGTYDGCGYPISGINITSDSNRTPYSGVFGSIDNSTVQNIVLLNSTITGKDYVGGIVGSMSASTVQNCYVDNTVTIKAEADDDGSYVGSIAGRVENGSTIAGCNSSAYVTGDGNSNCIMGGILGASNTWSQSADNTIQDCYYYYTRIRQQSNAIVGEAYKTTFNRAYYYSALNNLSGEYVTDGTCTGSPSFAHKITLGENVVLTGTQTTYNVSGIMSIGDNVLRAGNAYFCPQGKTVTVDDSAAPNGYDATTFTVNGTTISGKSFVMPDEDVTVNAATVTYVPVTYNINYVLNDGTNDANNPPTYTVESPDITLKAPTREGYYFDGWYTDEALTSAATTPHIPTGSTGDKTFYAKWTYLLTLEDRYSGSDSPIPSDALWKDCHVIINGRTLYKDGGWNTLCLPFKVDLTKAPFAGNNMKAMTLNTATFSDGTLTLNFVNKTSTIPSGTPFIIKWDGNGGTDNIVNPMFKDVTISTRTASWSTAEDVIKFLGRFNVLSFSAENHYVLFMGSNNTLYYPGAGASIGAFRGYFQLQGGITAGEPQPGQSGIKAFVLNFGDDEATAIQTTDNGQQTTDAAWYNLDGRKLNGKPSQKGIYINNGKKTIIP